MKKNFHEIRDPIHNFIKFDSDEKKVLDSKPLQRLRHIKQLATTFLIYPGATHTRFEHSLGVMELATRIFEVITKDENIQNDVRDIIPPKEQLTNWKRTLRMAALCHDIGHLPFSHAAEKELLPSGWTHERMTYEIIKSKEMRQIFENEMEFDLNVDRIAKIAIGIKDIEKIDPTVNFTDWELIVSEIIVGNEFGADRIDYLLRDSLHIGVAYGKFDYYRLIDTLRILFYEKGYYLGIEEGGIHSAEALQLARYYMFTQVYFHHVRRIYDEHLKDFLKSSDLLPDGMFSIEIGDFLKLTDNEVTSEIRKISSDESLAANDSAKIINCHKHFKLLYQKNTNDQKINIQSGRLVFEAIEKAFGPDIVRHSFVPPREKDKRQVDFPVLTYSKEIDSSMNLSEILATTPSMSCDYVFIAPNSYDKVKNWLEENRYKIILPPEEKEDDDECI